MSRSNARPCNVEWIRSIVRQCAEAGVPCFVKQLGANVEMSAGEWWRHTGSAGTGPFNPDQPMVVSTQHPKGGDWDEWPEDLRVRELPNQS